MKKTKVITLKSQSNFVIVGLITKSFPWRRDGEKPVKEKSKTPNSSLKGHVSCVHQVSGVSNTWLVIKELDSARNSSSFRASSKRGRN